MMKQSLWERRLGLALLISSLTSYIVFHIVGTVMIFFFEDYRLVVSQSTGVQLSREFLKSVSINFWLVSAIPPLTVPAYIFTSRVLNYFSAPSGPKKIGARGNWPTYIALVIGVSASVGVMVSSLIELGAFRRMISWVSGYTEWIASRSIVNNGLFLHEQLTIYVILPTFTATLIGTIYVHKTLAGPFRLIAMASIGSIIFLIHLMLFQRKQPIVFFLLISIVILTLMYFEGRSRRSLALGAGLTVFFATGIYGVLTILTSFSALYKEPLDLSDSGGAPLSASKANIILLGSTVLARTSLPALFYIARYQNGDFQKIDLPFDGYTTNENIVVGRLMFPDLKEVSVSASYQFNLFSQGGISIAILGSILLGIGFRIGVRLVTLRFEKNPAINATGAVWLGIAAITLPTESARDALFSSYGSGWGFCVILSMIILTHLRTSMHGRRIKSWSAAPMKKPQRGAPK